MILSSEELIALAEYMNEIRRDERDTYEGISSDLMASLEHLQIEVSDIYELIVNEKTGITNGITEEGPFK